MSVEEYTQKFMEYSRFCPNIVPDNAIMTQKYEDVLSVKIQKKLGGGTFSTLLEAYAKASNMERILKREEVILAEKKGGPWRKFSNPRSRQKGSL